MAEHIKDRALRNRFSAHFFSLSLHYNTIAVIYHLKGSKEKVRDVFGTGFILKFFVEMLANSGIFFNSLSFIVN